MRVLTEGTQLAGRYTLIRRIGGGGMADVWLADDARAGSLVALKFLKADALAGKRECFHDEWRTASRLMHAHIVRVFDYHDDDEQPYFAMQYLAGPSAGALDRLPVNKRVGPFGYLADALRYAHGKGLVHRDLKAANVLFDDAGAPYLVDFGVSRTTGSAADGSGSPIAASPAQRVGAPATPADDIYALGVLLHEVLTGQPPRDGQVHEDDLPVALRPLLATMLAPDADNRPAAGAVAAALAAAGYAPAPVHFPARASGQSGTADAVTVESLRPLRPAPASPAPAAQGGPTGGISPRLVGGGLAVLVLALLGVVYLLPETVHDDAQPPARATVPADDKALSTTSAESATASTVPTDSNDVADGDSRATGLPADEGDAAFSENVGPGGRRAATDEALGDLLSRLQRLRYRGIERWGGQEYLDAVNRYAAGDEAYLAKNYTAAGEHYRAATRMLEPFFDRIDTVFAQTMHDAKAAFEARDFREAIRLYDLATTITPGNAAAEKGLKRARNLESVLALTDQAETFEKNLELDAAMQALDAALKLDPEWQPAQAAKTRVVAALLDLHFEQRMTEGFDALQAENFDSARAAFEAAKSLKPESKQPGDGLLQVDQEARLARLRNLEATAAEQVGNEQWEAAIETYRAALDVDGDLQFAKDGLRVASERAALHKKLDDYIDDPDALSAPQTMQAATELLLKLSRISPSGPRLEDQKEQLSRLLKRAATPLTVHLQSDNQTTVTVYRVGRLGTFENRELNLRPGSYVATGSRPGYRDVRLEFRVAPEIELKPIIVTCEERI